MMATCNWLDHRRGLDWLPTTLMFPCRDLSTREVVFASIAGLRGSVSLIMAQAFVTESTTATPDARVRIALPYSFCLLAQVFQDNVLDVTVRLQCTSTCMA